MGAYDRSQSDPSERRNDSERSAGAKKTRYRLAAPVHREGFEKPFWIRVGTIFENPAKNGGSATLSIRIDSLPLNFNGELVGFLEDDDERNSAG